MASLNQFIDPDLSAGDIVHSSGYAQAGLGGAIGGSGGGLSMEQRRSRMHNRKIVGSYQHSKLGRGHSATKSRSVDQVGTRYYDGASGELTSNARYVNKNKGVPLAQRRSQNVAGRSTTATPQPPVRKFVEPPARRHNPYG